MTETNFNSNVTVQYVTDEETLPVDANMEVMVTQAIATFFNVVPVTVEVDLVYYLGATAVGAYIAAMVDSGDGVMAIQLGEITVMLDTGNVIEEEADIESIETDDNPHLYTAWKVAIECVQRVVRERLLVPPPTRHIQAGGQ